MYAHPAKFAGLGLYLAFVVGLLGFCIDMSLRLGAQMATLAQPALTAPGPRAPTLVERRLREGPAVAMSEPAFLRAASAVDAPATPIHTLAAQLDVSEAADLKGQKVAQRRAGRSRTAARKVRRPAGEVFARNFGVLLVASR